MVEDLECTLKFQDQCEDGKAITQHKVKGKEGWPKEQASKRSSADANAMPNRTNSSGATEIAGTRSTASARQTLLLQTRTTMA